MVPESPPLPWYRHFWPWFIVGLLGTAVTASLSTVVIAFVNQDDLVSDDYYREGVAINRRLDSERVAVDLGVGARARFDGGAVEIELWGRDVSGIQTLVFELSHATLAERDRVVWLDRSTDGRFLGSLPEGGSGRFYSSLRPADSAWRLSRAVDLPQRNAVEFGIPR